MFHEVADLTASERAKYFMDHAVDDEIRREVETLLAFDAGAAEFLENDISFAAKMALPQVEQKNWQCGPYRLLHMIGRGGMGAVYLAERVDGEVTQRLAVKLLPPGAGDPLRERFLRERQILASLVHPNIARMLDAGHGLNGQPFLAMEYIDGKPIDVFGAGFTVRQKITLFLKVCAAVSYLHRNVIVHRDLKPSNILVTLDGEPKLLDFGIAKILDVATDTTVTSMRMMTPDYASPEQVMGGRVSTAADIYSLGAVLYHLLTDKPAHEFDDHSSEAIARAITTREVTRPSKWTPELEGDVESILLKALRKDPQERYATVEQFTEDLQAFLGSRPVRARRDTLPYRVAKFVRRNHTAVTLTALTLVALLAGVIGTLIQTRTARQQREIACRERDRATRITDFMTSMFKVSDPSEARGNTVTAREILDKASKDIETSLAKDPETQAHMLFVMGTVYDSLGLIHGARPMLERALQLQKEALGPENPDTLRSAGLLGVILLEDGHEREAEKMQRDTLAVQRRVLGPEHVDTLTTMARLAAVLSWKGRLAEGEKLQREVLAIERRVLGPEDPKTLVLTTSLVGTLAQEGDQSRYLEAEKLGRETIAVERRVFGPEHPDTLAAMAHLGMVLCWERKYAESEQILREGLDIQLRVLGPEHPDTLDLRNYLAIDLMRQGRYQEAERLYRATRAAQRHVFGPEDALTAASTYNLGCLAALQGKTSQAISLLREAVDHGLKSDTAVNMEQDEDLRSLFGDPRFAAVIAHAKERATLTQQKQ